MNPNPNLNFNMIKGLQILIADIRNCTTREDEVKRVEFELDKIRKKFSANKVLTGYDKKKYVWKLIYIYILGYDVDFGHNYAADLITSVKYSEKVTGYIAMSILFKESSAEIDVMINSIKNDLLNQNPVCQSLALTLAANLNNKELLVNIYKEVLQFMTNYNEKQTYTIKKALIVLIKIIKVKPDILNSEKWCPALMKLAEIKHFELLLALCNLVYYIIQSEGPKGFEPLAEKLLNNILLRIKDCPLEYIYYHIKAPWLQIKLLQILSLFPVSAFSSEGVKNIKDYADYISKKTNGIVGAEVKYSRVYAEYCIFFESINFVDHFASVISEKTIDSFISILGIYLSETNGKGKKLPNKDINTKYLALDGLSKLSKYTTGNKILKVHCDVIISSLHDNDLSIRKKSLELMFLICTEDSVKLIIKEMLLYFKENEPQLKDDIALKVAILAEKYAQDFKFYIESILKMIELAGDYVTDDIIFRFYQLMTGFENQEQLDFIQKYAVEKISKYLEKDFVNENAIKLGALLFGEFGYESCEGNIDVCKKYIGTLKRHMMICGNSTILLILGSFMKMSKIGREIVNLVIPILEEYLESWDPEVQQRAVEYLIILKLEDESVKQKIFSRMPLFSTDSLNNSILMKRLSQTNKTLFSKTKEGQNVEKKDKVAANGELLISSNYNEDHPFYSHIIFQKDPMSFSPYINKFEIDTESIDLMKLQNNFNEFKQFLTNVNNSSPIFDSEGLSIITKVKPLEKGVLGAMLEIKHESNQPGCDLQLTTLFSPSGLDISISKFKYLETSTQVLLKIKLLSSYTQPIQLKFYGNYNGLLIDFDFALPLLITKYIDIADLEQQEYSSIWRSISNESNNDSQRLDSIMYNPLEGQKSLTDILKKIGSLMNGLGFKVFPPSNLDSFNEIEACGSLFINNTDSFLILIRASFIPSYSEEFVFSVRIKGKSDLNERFGSLSNDIHSIVRLFINPK